MREGREGRGRGGRKEIFFFFFFLFLSHFICLSVFFLFYFLNKFVISFQWRNPPLMYIYDLSCCY